MRFKIGKYIGQLVVTGLALTLAVLVIASRWGQGSPDKDGESQRVIPPTPVSVMQLQLESIEITDAYSGMIRPRERFSIGFEIAGRVDSLGVSKKGRREGKLLDEGDWVGAGNVLARLDDLVSQARLKEAKALLDQAKAQVTECSARLEKAQSDMARSEELKRRGTGVITPAEYQDVVAKLAVADAQATAARAQAAAALAKIQTAAKNLADCTLLSPVSGVISKRHVNAGESVSPHQPIMEILQVDEVLLVVGVPEAYVGEILAGQPVHVELLARDRFRRKRPTTEGRVYQVAEAADQTTGLFEVEVLLPNPQGRWKPGLIALAVIVIDRVRGFRVPMACAVFRREDAFLFALDEVAKDLKAHRFDLQDWIDEGSDLIVPVGSKAFRGGKTFLFSPGEDGKPRRFDLPDGLAEGSNGIVAELPEVRWTVINRGQHRLVDGRSVRLVAPAAGPPAKMDSQPLFRPAAEVVESKP